MCKYYTIVYMGLEHPGFCIQGMGEGGKGFVVLNQSSMVTKGGL